MNSDDFLGDVTSPPELGDNFLTDPSNDVSFGTSNLELYGAEKAYSLGEIFPNDFLQNCCNAFGDFLCGANQPGMEEIRSIVGEMADFFKMERPRVFYEPGELGGQMNGFTSAKDDNWICSDPEKLREYSEQYGADFQFGTFAHEASHNLLDCIHWEHNHTHRANEAASDYLAGIYMGSKGRDPEGFATFLREEGNTGDFPEYPTGDEREALFRQGYEEASQYVFRSFQSVMDDPGFNLGGKLHDIAERYE